MTNTAYLFKILALSSFVKVYLCCNLDRPKLEWYCFSSKLKLFLSRTYSDEPSHWNFSNAHLTIPALAKCDSFLCYFLRWKHSFHLNVFFLIFLVCKLSQNWCFKNNTGKTNIFFCSPSKITKLHGRGNDVLKRRKRRTQAWI